jgi:glycosyltransferase A (GT-A) superfamily protein (DUF2064 family)
VTTIAVLVDPPRPGLVFDRLAATSPLTDAECADLYAAATKDVCHAVAESGGDLLVNFRPDESLPEQFRDGDVDAEAELRELVDPVTEDPRFEVQVGETFAGRVGNTATHLLETEGEDSVAAATPNAPLLTRRQVDEAAMKLRRSEVVLGPAPGGRVYYAAFREPVDFEDAYAPPTLGTLTDRALDAGYDADFLTRLPVIETGSDLADLLVTLRTRRKSGRTVPDHTADTLEGFGLVVEATDDGLTLAR